MVKGTEVETRKTSVTRGYLSMNMESFDNTLAREERMLDRMNGTDVESFGQSMQDSRITLARVGEDD
jgi:hypothetical protein